MVKREGFQFSHHTSNSERGYYGNYRNAQYIPIYYFAEYLLLCVQET